MTLAGMATLVLSGRGQLGYLEVLPPQLPEPRPTTNTADFSPLFKRAELDLSQFTPDEPRWTPNFFADERRAWVGHFPGQPDWPVRVEAAAFQGRPVYFQVIDPPDRPWRRPPGTVKTTDRLWQGAGIAFDFLLIVGVVLFARRNLRLGRSDRRGAWRLAIAFLLLSTLSWILMADHFRWIGSEWFAFKRTLWPTLATALFVGCAYLALEPYTRRLWPNSLSSWTRLLMGRIGDPLVGRDLLLGGLGGLLVLVLQRVEPLIPVWLDAPPRVPYVVNNQILEGGREALGALVDPAFVTLPFVLTLILTAWAGLLKRTGPAVVGTLILMFVVDSHWRSGDHFDVAMASAVAEVLLVWSILLFVLIRIGLLAVLTAWFFIVRIQDSPLLLSPAAWYASGSWMLLVSLLAVTTGAAFISMGLVSKRVRS